MEIKPVHPKGNQPWRFIGRTNAATEAPILWPPDGKSWLTWKNPELGKIEDRKRRGQQRMRCSDGITHLMDISLSQLQKMAKDMETWRAAVHGAAKSWTWLSDWTDCLTDTEVVMSFLPKSLHRGRLQLWGVSEWARLSRLSMQQEPNSWNPKPLCKIR